MEAGAYLPRPVEVSMMLKRHMKRGFWPVAGRIALRASGGWLEDQSLRTVQVAGQLQHALLAARRGHDLDAGSQTEEYGQGVDVLRLQVQALASGGFLEGGQDLIRLSLRRARVPPGTWAGVWMG
jgi:hypothetical protein